MRETLQAVINKLSQERSDARLNIFKVEIISFDDNRLTLSGQVLSLEDLQALAIDLLEQFPEVVLDVGGIEVMRKTSNTSMTVGTNLTSLHTSTSFISEMSSQMIFGDKVEILAEQGNWVYTRQLDGYLGWTYKPYLTTNKSPQSTHIVLAPAVPLLAQPEAESQVLTRVFSGTRVNVLTTQEEWAQVSANQTGWMKLKDLRAISEFPKSVNTRREVIQRDAQRLIGVPYLWGGSAGNGIDCSGFARLLHRLVGIELPRDADMQAAQCKRVEAPYEPGDLFFFGEGDSNRHISHVGVCMGGTRVMHSSRSRNGVYLDDLQEKESLHAIFSHAGSFLGK